jgi:Na+/proline symporter
LLAAYLGLLLFVGVWQQRRARGVDDYFVSGRKLPWWIAGTSMIAASFASDTPLLVSGLVRSKGVWGNWQWWGLGISTILTVFFFARLWRRAHVVTEAELAEIRYSGRSAAALRCGRAIWFGVLYNCFAAGAWSVAGLAKVLGQMTGLDRNVAILVCAGIGAVYAVASGLWGLVATDCVQFVAALIGSIAVAFFAVNAAGGIGAIVASVPSEKLAIVPLEGPGLEYLLPFVLVQWWAWKNTDGGGLLVQRMSACKNERHAVYATLWFNVAHYALRSWPWILVGLASIVLIPDSSLPRLASGAPDHESAYAAVLSRYVPAGLRGLVVAWFVAEFMSAITQAMNWGSSLLVNDVYRRFIRPDASERRMLAVSRLLTLVIMTGALVTAFLSDDISRSFNYVLQGTAAVGVVSVLRWLWWRINAWSEIAAMVASPVFTFLLATPILRALSLPDALMPRLLVVVLGSTAVMLAVTFLTPQDDPARLAEFYRRVRPPGPGWRRIAVLCPGVRPDSGLGLIVAQWLTGVALVFSAMIGVGTLVLGDLRGLVGIVLALGLAFPLRRLMRRADAAEPLEPTQGPSGNSPP